MSKKEKATCDREDRKIFRINMMKMLCVSPLTHILKFPVTSIKLIAFVEESLTNLPKFAHTHWFRGTLDNYRSIPYSTLFLIL